MIYSIIALTAIFLNLNSAPPVCGLRDIHVNASCIGSPLRKFWTSTGFSSPSPRSAQDYLLSKEMELNLAYIASLPLGGVQQVRVHWLLELVKITESSSDTSNPQWDFNLLDHFLDVLVTNKLRVGFEVMGNPGNYFTNFTYPSQIRIWRRLVRQMAMRYFLRYGAERVSKWKFEMWNEPDLKMYNTLNMTFKGYLNYVRATVKGLRAAESDILKLYNSTVRFRLGGPAGTFKSQQIHLRCWGLMRYCNHLSRQNKSCGLDFISFHHKGNGTSAGVINGGLDLVRTFEKKYPALWNIPFANDEADPETGWWRLRDWRADQRYAAMLVGGVIDHQYKWVNDGHLPPLEIISNDNGFLESRPFSDRKSSAFKQRTLMTSFDTENEPLQMFRKPVMSAMAMLSLLGESQISAKSSNISGPPFLKILATTTRNTTSWEVGVLLAYHNETCKSRSNTTLNIVITGLPKFKVSNSTILRVLRISSQGKGPQDPYTAWKLGGSPQYPDKNLRLLMRRLENPKVTQLSTIRPADDNNSVRVVVTASVASCHLIQVCSFTSFPPGPATDLRAINITYNQVLLLWTDSDVRTRCLKTYEVYFRPNDAENWSRINEETIFFLSFQYEAQESFVSPKKKESVRGEYMVRAVDFWSRQGPISKVLHYP